jgi:hypothetical protein
MAEMKAAKDETGRIKITAGLYLLSKQKHGAEVMKRVSIIELSDECERLKFI